MTNSLLIGKYIYAELKKNINCDIVPFFARETTKFPFITYERASINSYYCKDGNYQDEVLFNINIYSTNYEETLDLANKVRQALELYDYTDDNIIIDGGYLESANENYTNEGSYYQSLQFKFIIR